MSFLVELLMYMDNSNLHDKNYVWDDTILKIGTASLLLE